MKKRYLLPLLLTLPAFSGEIAINCDSRGINEKACIALLQDSLKTVGCASSETSCNLHPWGSDFIKSWICTAQSSNCSPTLQVACPNGSLHAFNETIDVCTSSKSVSVQGVCKHEHAAHTFNVKSCGEGPATCAKFGGTAGKCSQPEGFSEWQVVCEFPSLQIAVSGSNCPELQSKCELINTKKGVKGSLLSCFPQK